MDFLVVDDDPLVRNTVKRLLLAHEGNDVRTASGPEPALAELERAEPQVIILDYSMPGVTGLGLLEEIRRRHPDCEVVMLTAHDHVPTAVQAIRLGACDYLVKPLEPAQLDAAVDRLQRLVALRRENQELRARAVGHAASALVGDAPAMASVRSLVARAARRDSTVLITGEHGTGKELVARTLHEVGPRARKPFVAVECSSVSAALFESELFGHVRGAFTGADRARTGLCEAAGEGTLFLDEVAEIPTDLQSKLLRVLQEREFRPVGSNERSPLRARVVAATNVRIDEAIAAGRLREDLYYRLDVIRIELPPLRARKADVPQLAERFLAELAQPGDRVRGFAPEALERLQDYGWPGNVRELKNVVERTIAVAEGELIRVEDLPQGILRRGGGAAAAAADAGSGSSSSASRSAAAAAERDPARPAAPGPAPAAGGHGAGPDASEAGDDLDSPSMPVTLDEMERLMIRRALRCARGNVSVAASQLGVSPSTIYRKLKAFGMEGDAERASSG